MAITNKGAVGTFAPVYNPMWFYMDSTNKSRDGFRYIFDLYDAGTVNYTRYNPPPRPGDGYGQLDIAPILQCRIGYNADPNNLFAIAAKNSFFKYDLKIGEEYLASFTYTGYAQLTGTGTQFDGKVRLNGLVAHTFVVGDQIEVSQTDGGVAVPLLQSLFTVVYVPNTTSVVIDLNYYLVSGLPAMGGTIYYSDKRKVQVANLLTLSNYTAYNGALDVAEFNGYDFAARQMTAETGNKKFLTSMPDGFTLSPYANARFNLANMGTTVPYYLRIENSNGEVFRKDIAPDVTSQLMQVPVGAGDMSGSTVISGVLPVIKDTTTSYTVQVMNIRGVAVSEKRTFNIDRRCDSKEIILLFIDRQGSLAPFSFPLQAIHDNDFDREIYTAGNGGLNTTNSKYEYDPLSGGRTVIYSERKEGMTLRTNWLTWEQANYFEELLGSPVVLLRMRGGIYQAVEVVTATQPLQHVDKKKLINREIQVKYSNLNPINA